MFNEDINPILLGPLTPQNLSTSALMNEGTVRVMWIVQMISYWHDLIKLERGFESDYDDFARSRDFE